ncbi:XAC0095 family protein [Noviluteimonas gilva]|uniref:XAC0095-like domain-containing protein n=1 Tax=Noviluteimonas gilva TaxID=2682097 RepID=A0A7C9HWM3_9GAMM|nr:hypothetical protein [Lysobacter gilvus]MUV15338.1 hypothetical protein [Lysobacter gilvus]
MRNPQRTVLVVSETAKFDLIRLREHLRLLSKLTDTGTAASGYDQLLHPDALGWWFSRIARDLDEIVEEIHYCPDIDRAAQQG